LSSTKVLPSQPVIFIYHGDGYTPLGSPRRRRDTSWSATGNDKMLFGGNRHPGSLPVSTLAPGSATVMQARKLSIPSTLTKHSLQTPMAQYNPRN
jgi:hypothetical protein